MKTEMEKCLAGEWYDCCLLYTSQRYETTTRYLEEFIKKEYQLSDIALNNLEANFISKFDAFLKIEKDVYKRQLVGIIAKKSFENCSESASSSTPTACKG